MTRPKHRWHRSLAMQRAVALGGAVLVFGGCGSDDHFHHDPPPGAGSIIVDNRTSDDIKVYVDGYYAVTVDSYDYEWSDQDPGEYRVVLEQKSGDRTFRDDVDVIEGKRMVMEVTYDPFYWNDYQVRYYIDD